MKLSSQAVVKGDVTKDEGLKRLNQKEAKAWASTLRFVLQHECHGVLISYINVPREYLP